MKAVFILIALVMASTVQAAPVNVRTDKVNLDFAEQVLLEGTRLVGTRGTTAEPVIQAQVAGLGDLSWATAQFSAAIYQQNLILLRQHEELMKALRMKCGSGK